MKSVNYYLRVICGVLTGEEYEGHFKDNFFLRRIAESYGRVYSDVKRSNKYLKDWCEEVTGEVVDEHMPNWFYVRRIAGFLDSGVLKNKHMNYYLRVISELIDSKESSSVSLGVSSVSPFVSDTVVLSGVLEPFGGVVKLYDGDSLLDTLTASSVDGSFSKSWTAILGSHSFRVVFEETEEYRGSESETVVVNVVKKNTSLSLSAVDSSLYVDDDLVLTGSLLWGVNPVSGASVKLYQDETLLDTLTTDSNGSFSKTVSGLNAGDYEYFAVFDGTNVYESSQSQDVQVEVSKYATSLSLNVPMNLVYSDSFNLSGVLVDENNNVLKNMSVKLLVDNVEKATTSTSNDGTASFTQTPVRTGNHAFQLSFAGTYKYESTDSSVVSRVVDKETSVLSVSSPTDNSSHYVNDDISVAGSLLEDDGVVMKSKSIMVGDKGTVTTGNDGTFNKTISYDVKGTKTLTISYAGDENYTASSVTRTLTLLQKTPVITVAGSESEIYTNESVVISGTLKYNNNPVKNHSIKIYDGSTLLDTVTTGNDGSYSKTVSGLTKGVHLLKAVSVENNEYESVTSSNVSVEVFNVIAGVSIESDKSIISGYHSEVCTLTAKLVDSDGAVVTKDNLNITFKKDGTAIGSAVATTDGVATKTFNASNGGELELKAEYSTFHDTCTVEDIYAYQTLTTDDGNWTKDTEVNATFNNNGLTVTSSTNAGKFMRWGVNPPTYYSTEVEIQNLGSEQFSSSIGIEDAYIMNNNTENKILGNRITYSSSEMFNVSPKLNVGDIVKMVFDGYNIVFYRNGNYVGVIHKSDNVRSVFFRTYGVRVLTVKNLKMRSLDISSVLLASDKEILSYVDSDTATLSATVKDSNGVAITTAGVPVSFYNGATLLGTAYTNNNGVATYSYVSTGYGEVNLTAKIGNIDSNNITIVDINNILLSSDKTILSFDDEETSTLTATVKDTNGNNIPVANIPVNFYNGNTLLGTSLTDNNGTATYTYTSQGTGDTTITAKIGSINSNDITIEDCLKYGFQTTDTYHDINSTYTSTIQYNEGVITIRNKALDYDIDMTQDFIIEAECYPSGDSTGWGIVEKNITDNIGKSDSVIQWYSGSTGRFLVRNATAGDVYRSDTFALTTGAWFTLKLVKEGNSLKAYVNDVQKGETVSDITGAGITTANMKVVAWNNSRNVKVRNLKIKPI